jgi:hypothetical protein
VPLILRGREYIFDLILKCALLRVSRRMQAPTVASWFETAQGRLLTMRGGFVAQPESRPFIADIMLAAEIGYVGRANRIEGGIWA